MSYKGLKRCLLVLLKVASFENDVDKRKVSFCFQTTFLNSHIVICGCGCVCVCILFYRHVKDHIFSTSTWGKTVVLEDPAPPVSFCSQHETCTDVFKHLHIFQVEVLTLLNKLLLSSSRVKQTEGNVKEEEMRTTTKKTKYRKEIFHSKTLRDNGKS